MKSRILALTLLPALLWLTSPSARGQERTVPNDTEVLARGPVHEGFAEPVDYRPQPGPIIAKKVPDPVEEAPPDQKPDGHDVAPGSRVTGLGTPRATTTSGSAASGATFLPVTAGLPAPGSRSRAAGSGRPASGRPTK